MFVTTKHIVSPPDDRTLEPGNITYGIRTPTPQFELSRVHCPFCGGRLKRALNAGKLKIHRVARVLGPERNGEYPFLGSLFPSANSK